MGVVTFSLRNNFGKKKTTTKRFNAQKVDRKGWKRPRLPRGGSCWGALTLHQYPHSHLTDLQPKPEARATSQWLCDFGERQEPLSLRNSWEVSRCRTVQTASRSSQTTRFQEKKKTKHQEPAVAFSYIIHFEKGGFHKSGISMLNCATPVCERVHVARTCCRDGD